MVGTIAYCYNRPFQNRTIGNPNIKLFGIPLCLVCQCLVFKPPLYWSHEFQIHLSAGLFCARGQFQKLIYALRPAICALRPTFEKLCTGAKVRCKAQRISVGGKTVYKINPRFLIVHMIGWPFENLIMLAGFIMLTQTHTRFWMDLWNSDKSQILEPLVDT